MRTTVEDMRTIMENRAITHAVIENKRALRASIAGDVERFIANGGAVQQFAVGESAYDLEFEETQSSTAEFLQLRYKNKNSFRHYSVIGSTMGRLKVAAA